MEVSEKSDCEKNIENTSEENVAITSKNIVQKEFNESMEIDVNKINSSNNEEHLIGVPPEIESQPTFKKPVVLIGPRKGKPNTQKLIKSSDSCNADKSVNPEYLTNEEVITKSDSKIDVSSRIETEKQVEKSNEKQTEIVEKVEKCKEKQIEIKEKQLREKKQIIEKVKQIPLPYKEPTWGGKPEKKYKAEILKSGLILETIDLSEKSFHVIGRLPICDIPLTNPTISRYHAIFQYRSEPDEKNEAGLYIYDLGSTHGTFWNGNRIMPNKYIRVRCGHMIKFGNSQRKFIMLTPQEEEEEESDLTVTELKVFIYYFYKLTILKIL